MPEHAWIITPGAYADVDLPALGINAHPKHVMVYTLSDIGRYLLSPAPIEVESRLLGCECFFKPRGWRRVTSAAVRLMHPKPRTASKRHGHPDTDDRRLLLARHFVRMPVLQDRQLACHIDRIRGLLHPLDPVAHEIARIPIQQLADIRGVCEDEGGHRTYINLSGDLEAKRRYVLDHLLKRVPITLTQARIADGLYDMRGLDPKRCRSERHHRLLKFQVNGHFFVCLLNRNDNVAFWVDDADRLRQLLLTQQALETNPALNRAFEDCYEERARALRLMINPEMDIDYSRNRLPKVYETLFASLELNGDQQQGVIRSLNDQQMAISFSFVPQGIGDSRAMTCISVLHDVKALETFRQAAPELYAEINRKATLSEAGRYYLLESIEGHPDEEGL